MLNVNNYHSQSSIARFENKPASTASDNICSKKKKVGGGGLQQP